MSAIKKVAVVTTVVTTATVAVYAVGRFTRFGRFVAECGKFGWDYVMTFERLPSYNMQTAIVEAIYKKHFG